MKKVVWLFLVFFISSTQALAQDEIPALPTPEELFAEGVIFELVPPRINPQSTQPTADNEARVVRVYDEATETWREFPFPNEVEQFVEITREDENILALSTEYPRGPYGTQALPEAQWLLNVVTGEYSRPEIICGERRASEGEGYWVVYQEALRTPGFLCNTETGARLEPLPIEEWWDTQPAVLSPDGEQLILFGHGTIYSYRFETGELTLLGTPQKDFQYAEWIGNDLVFISAANQAEMSSPWRNYYLAYPGVEDSMYPITTTIKPAGITHLYNPSRYEWLAAGADSCSLRQLNTETAELNEYELQEICSQGTSLPGTDDRLFYDIMWSDENLAYWDDMVRLMYLPDGHPIGSQLVRLNPYTGERQNLYAGEIEWLRDVTPDGQYAVLLVDDSGLLDMIAPRKGETPDSHPLWLILDLHTGEIVYEAPTSWSSSDGYYFWNTLSRRIDFAISSINEQQSTMHRLPASGLFSVGNELFVHEEISYVLGDAKFNYTIIQLRDGEVFEQQLDEIALIMPDERHVAVWDDVETSSAVSLYDLETGTTTPIIRGQPTIRFTHDSVHTEAYSLSLSAESDSNAIQVYLCPIVDGEPDCSQSVTYRVQIGNEL